MKRKVCISMMAIAFLAAGISLAAPDTAYAIGDGKVTEVQSKGAENAWLCSGGKWYYIVDQNKVTGWKKINGKWYYFSVEGVMMTGWVNVSGKWYYLKNSGAMATGWVKDGAKWYYLKSDGAMATGWLKDGTKWYYLKRDGSMACNEWANGYWLGKTGVWNYKPRGSWLLKDKGWRFEDTSGWYARSSVVTINSKEYVFDSEGYLVENPKWIMIGDSIVEKNFTSEKGFYEYVQEEYECSPANYGFSGMGYKETAGDRGNYSKIAGTIDLSDADCITIFGSFNDLGKGYKFGTVNDTTTDTIGGCMDLTIKTLKERAPGVPIGIVTPTPWLKGLSHDAEGKIDYNGTTSAECEEYIQLLKDLADKYDLQVLDLNKNSGLNPDDPDNRKKYYETERYKDYGVHPNALGHKLMAPLWKEFIMQLLATG